jgi:hypothetical protein
MRQKQQYAVLARHAACNFIEPIHPRARRFHSAEILDALSVLPKAAEQQRRQAKRAAKLGA